MASRSGSNLKPSKGQAFWDQHISTFQHSSLSKVAYCREHGLAQSTFDNWRRKLKAMELAQSAPTDFATMDFTHKFRASDTSSTAPGAIEIQFGQGVVVKINAPVDRETLLNVLQVVRQLA